MCRNTRMLLQKGIQPKVYSYLSNKRACTLNYFGLFFHPARTYCMPACLTIFSIISTLHTKYMPARLTIFQVFSTPRTLFFFSNNKISYDQSSKKQSKTCLGKWLPRGTRGSNSCPQGEGAMVAQGPQKGLNPA